MSSNTTNTDFTHDGGVIAAIFIALLSFILTCVVNALATTGPNSNPDRITTFRLDLFECLRLELFNKSTAQISDENPTEFTPAGPTFSLWGLIYSWQVRCRVEKKRRDESLHSS